MTVLVDIKVEKHSRENATALREALAALPEVVACRMVSGTADFILEIAVANLKAYERFLSERLLTLPMIGDIRSNFVLTQVKADAPLPLTHLEGGIVRFEGGSLKAVPVQADESSAIISPTRSASASGEVTGSEQRMPAQTSACASELEEARALAGWFSSRASPGRSRRTLRSG